MLSHRLLKKHAGTGWWATAPRCMSCTTSVRISTSARRSFGTARQMFSISPTICAKGAVRLTGQQAYPRSAPNLDGSPADLATDGEQRAIPRKRDPASAILGLLRSAIEPGDLRAAQAAREAAEQDGAVAIAPRIVRLHRAHGEDVLGEEVPPFVSVAGRGCARYRPSRRGCGGSGGGGKSRAGNR